MKLHHNMKQLFAFCQGPLVQPGISLEEPFAKVPAVLKLLGAQEHRGSVIEVDEEAQGFQCFQHVPFLLFLPVEKLLENREKGEAKVFGFCPFGFQLGILGMWFLWVHHHAQLEVCELGGCLCLFVAFLHLLKY